MFCQKSMKGDLIKLSNVIRSQMNRKGLSIIPSASSNHRN